MAASVFPSLGKDQISVGIPGATNVGSATECATKPARLYFYDWQNNLVGPAAVLNGTDTTADPTQTQKELRQSWIDAGRPPTEGFNRQLIAQAAGLGAKGYILKPLRPAYVEGLVRKLFGARQG